MKNRDNSKNSLDSVLHGVEILEEKDIFYFPVKNYLGKRKISVDTAKLYQKEVWFKVKGKRYFGLSHKNISDGYEISGCGSSRFKCAVGNKDISFFKGSDKSSKAILIFEGIFDFMSYLESEGNKKQGNDNEVQLGKSKDDVIVLNTCALWKRGVEIVEESGGYAQVELYLDSDKVGKETTQNIINELVNTNNRTDGKYEVVDKSLLYTGFKDFGEWWENGCKK